MPDIDHYLCPRCGAEVRVGGPGCPRCAPRRRKRRKQAPERRAWQQDESHDGLDLPDDDDFDYRAFVEEEFGSGTAKHDRRHWRFIATGVILLVALIFLWVLGGW